MTIAKYNSLFNFHEEKKKKKKFTKETLQGYDSTQQTMADIWIHYLFINHVMTFELVFICRILPSRVNTQVDTKFKTDFQKWTYCILRHH